MKSGFVIAVGVAGRDRGFHLAVLRMNRDYIRSICNMTNPENISTTIRNEIGYCHLIAIDATPKAHVVRDQTRISERELHADG